MEPAEIYADGLRLRPWQPGDADEVHRACQDPDIQRWTGVPSPYLPEHAVNFVTVRAPNSWTDGTAAPFAVCDAATGELLGSCGLSSIDRTLRSAEVGYWIVPGARGRGVAVRATRAASRWAFEALGLRRVIWQAEVGNHASRLVALRAGFRIEGRLRLADPHPGGGPDGWVGSLLPGDLAETAPAGATGRAAMPAGPGSLDARRAAVFCRPQPVLYATRGAGETPGAAVPQEIRLRRPEERDVDGVVTACRDPETVRWTIVPDPYHRSDAVYFVHDYAVTAWARGTGVAFAIADPTDAYAGSIDLRLSPTDPVLADVGFMAAPHVRGRGYVPAALAAVCAWGFTTLGLARIEWRAEVGNTASRRAAEKAGFVFEGTARGSLPHRGKRVDAWVGALLAENIVR